MRNPETGEQPGLWDSLFGCHKGDPGTGADLACAGWLAQFGIDHPRVRYLLFRNLLPANALEPGPNWPPLHETWADIVRAHTLVDPGGHLATEIDETDVLDTTAPPIIGTDSPSRTGTSGTAPETTNADHASRGADDAGERGNTIRPRKDSPR